MTTVLPTGAAPAPSPVDPVAHHSSRLVAYRDDGPIARLLGALTKGHVPPLLPAVVAGGVTLVLLLVGVGEQVGPPLFAPVLALLFIAPSAGHPHEGRLDWLVPPIMRAAEYGYLGVLGFAHGVSQPLVYALLGVLAYHHYDTVYRTRQKLWPREWVFRAGLGWDGRMLIAAVAAAAGVLPVAYLVLVVYLGVLFGAESIYAWTGTERGSGVMVNLEEEEEAGS